MPTTELSIIIVSWNVKKLLAKCLESIFKNQGNLDLEIIVVDNASKDKTVEMIKQEFSRIKLIANNKNLGFAKANNQGIKQSQGEFILILNPDTEIIGNGLEKMLEFMKQNQKAGIAGCQHLNPDKTIQPSVRRFPTLVPILLILTKIAKILPNLPSLKKYLAKDFNYKQQRQVDQTAGSFLMIRRQVIEKIGLFDEKFFTWFEEVDLCKRAKNAGWEIWYTPVAEIIHHGGASFKQQLTLKNQRIFFQSAWRYFNKH